MVAPSDRVAACADIPLSCGAPSAHASLGLHLATRTSPISPAIAYRDHDDVLEAHARGVLGLADTVRVDGWTTTAGRFLVAACLPPAFRDRADAPWDAQRGVAVLAQITRELHVELAARSVAALEQLGRYVADRSGFSLTIDDFAAPRELDEILAAVAARTSEANQDYEDGMCTDGERVNRISSIWRQAADAVRIDARKQAPDLDPLAACAASAPGTPSPEELRSFRGVREPPRDITPGQTGTFAGGFGCHEYFLSCAEARAATTRTRARVDQAELLLRDLLAVLGDVEIIANDCGTPRGMPVRALELPGGPASLAAILEGRVTAAPVATVTGEPLATANQLITPALARRIAAAQLPSVQLRDVRTCDATGGVCARCFGLAPEDAIWPTVGDDVGARAAEAITAAAVALPTTSPFFIC
jgi:DNA-directed RNA polymerase subunit beta'